MLRRTLISLAPSLALGLVEAPARAADAGPTLTFRLGEDPETLYNVQSISLTVAEVLGDQILEGLVYLDRKGLPQPWLAQSWSVSNDQKEITFKLRPGVKFHDGTDFNADAVKFHFTAIQDPQNASPLLPLIGPLHALDVPDPLTVRFTFAKPFAPFFTNLSLAQLYFNSPTAVAKYGKTYGRHPVGTGPYRFVSWNPGAEIDLERNPDYHPQWRSDAENKGAPYAARIVLRVIEEDGVAAEALETGELTASNLTADIIPRFVHDPGYKVIINKNVTNLLFLEFNERRPTFQDFRFRQAMSYAINREAIVQASWSGYAAPALGPLAVGIPGYDAGVVAKYGMPYDPAKAKALLADAGWKPGPGGLLEKNGQKARFLIKSYAGFTAIDRALAVIQSNLKDLGVDATLQTSDWGVFYPSLLRDDWDMDLDRWTWPDGAVLTQLFRSPGHRNSTLPDPKVDSVLDRCNTLMEPTQRNVCLGEAQQVLLQAMTIVPILTNWTVIATQKNVLGYDLDFEGGLIPGDVHLAKT